MAAVVAEMVGNFDWPFVFPAAGLEVTTASSPRLQAESLCHELTGALSSEQLVEEGQIRRSLLAVITTLETPHKAEEAVTALLAHGVPALMLAALPSLDFEARKDVMRLLGDVLKLGTPPVVAHVRDHPRVLALILAGCDDPKVALHCHTMVRACARSEALVRLLLEAGFVDGLLELAGRPDFDISSDAFASLRELLLAHGAVAASHLEARLEPFFEGFNRLLLEECYATRRQALRLLRNLLLERPFMKVMVAYVREEQFLQIHMNLLRDTSRPMQQDAFHVFKLFAANPRKPLRVQQILQRNRERLVKVVEAIQPPSSEDAAFSQDRAAVVAALWALEPRRVSPRQEPAAAAAVATAAACCV